MQTMKTKLILAAAVVGWVCAAAADDYDFYAGLRYPGAKLRPDVGVYKVKEEGAGDPKAYERREVDWWPRKGVDIIDVKEGMPLRTWTLRTQQRPSGPKQFQAHLLGFRGMGNTMGGRGQVTLTSATNYPLDGQVTLTVDPSSATKFPLYLRVPAWCAKYTATAAGQTTAGKAGELLKLERLWKPGDKVEISIDLTVQLLDGGKSYPGCVAIQRGPQVLAFDATLNPAGHETVELKSTNAANVKLNDASAKLPADWKTRQAYEVEGKEEPLVLVPFADAGQTGGEYRVWLGPLPVKPAKRK